MKKVEGHAADRGHHLGSSRHGGGSTYEMLLFRRLLRFLLRL